MTKEKALAFFKTFVTFAGTFLIGKAIFGTTVTEHIWELVGGALALVLNAVFALREGTATPDFIVATVTNFVAAVGGILVAAGKLSTEDLKTYLGFISSVLSFVLAVSVKKVEQQVQERVTLALRQQALDKALN